MTTKTDFTEEATGPGDKSPESNPGRILAREELEHTRGSTKTDDSLVLAGPKSDASPLLGSETTLGNATDPRGRPDFCAFNKVHLTAAVKIYEAWEDVLSIEITPSTAVDILQKLTYYLDLNRTCEFAPKTLFPREGLDGDSDMLLGCKVMLEKLNGEVLVDNVPEFYARSAGKELHSAGAAETVDLQAASMEATSCVRDTNGGRASSV